MVRSNLYDESELGELKNKSLEELQQIHGERTQFTQIERGYGSHRKRAGGRVKHVTRTSALAEKRVTRSCELQTKFTLADMERFAAEAWGDLGMNVVTKWADFNEAYFDKKLRPIPLIITPTLPYGSVSPTA